MVSTPISTNSPPVQMPQSNSANQSTKTESATTTKTTPNKTNGWFMKTVKAVWRAVKWLFKVIVGVALFVMNPSFFAVGFVVGIVMNDKVQVAVDKIKLVWNKQPWTVAIIFGLGAFLALPITLAASALLFGANLGASLTNYAQEKQDQDSKTNIEQRRLFADPDAIKA